MYLCIAYKKFGGINFVFIMFKIKFRGLREK